MPSNAVPTNDVPTNDVPTNAVPTNAVPAVPTPIDRPLRWAIAATGSIAAKFAAGFVEVDDAELYAVASRTHERAAEFAAEWNIGRAHTYESLAEDSEVDVVYVATPQHRHRDDAVRYLDAGFHVLCEKPFAMNRAEVDAMVAAARRNNRFLMEAMWSRFLPGWIAAKERIDAGAIGDVVTVEASFGISVPDDPTHRLRDPAQGGGALLDIGIYPVTFSVFLLGMPTRIVASGRRAGGVNVHNSTYLEFSSGATALLWSSIESGLSIQARVVGTTGVIDVPMPFHAPARFAIVGNDGEKETVETPMTGTGLNYQAQHATDRIRAGELESPVMPLAESERIIDILDEIASQFS